MELFIFPSPHIATALKPPSSSFSTIPHAQQDVPMWSPAQFPSSYKMLCSKDAPENVLIIWGVFLWSGRRKKERLG